MLKVVHDETEADATTAPAASSSARRMRSSARTANSSNDLTSQEVKLKSRDTLIRTC